MQNSAAIYTLNLINLSKALGISERHAENLKKEGIIVQVAHGKFDVRQSIENYYARKYKAIAKKSEIDFNTEKAYLTKAQRELAELELSKEREEVILAIDIEKTLTKMLLTFRSRVLDLPAKIAPQVIRQKDLATIEKIVKAEVYVCLTELAEYKELASEKK